MVDNLILPLEIEAIVLSSYIPVLPLLGHSCWSRAHDGLQCRASLPSPLVGCLTSIYINCPRVVLLKPSCLMVFGALLTNESNCISIACQLHLNGRSWARATTNSSKDEPGSKTHAMNATNLEPKAWFINTLKQVYQHRSLPSPNGTIRCDIYYGPQKDLRLTAMTSYFVQSMASETTSRWSRL